LPLLLAVSASAKPLPPLEGLEILRKSFSGMNDFTADIVQEKQLSVMKRKLVSTGTIRFRKPDRFFMEINPPYPSRLLLSDNILKLHMPREKNTSQMVLPPEQGLQRWFAYLAKPVTSLPDGMDVRADRQGELVSVTIAPRGSGQVKELTVTLSSDGSIRRLSIAEQRGDRTIMTFSRLRRNVGLTDRDFRLEH
jgi:outer membrane lipoprotein carrier protein